jgi:hypothetical protein
MDLLEEFSQIELTFQQMKEELQLRRQDAEKCVSLQKALEVVKDDNVRLSSLISMQQDSLLKAVAVQKANQNLLQLNQLKDDEVTKLIQVNPYLYPLSTSNLIM